MCDLKERINKAMRDRGMSQADLCRVTKMGSSKISQLLTGKVQDPRLSTMVVISQALDVSLDYLAGLKQTPEVRLSRDEGELLLAYRDLPPDKRDNLRSNARFLVSEERKSAVHRSEVAAQDLREGVA